MLWEIKCMAICNKKDFKVEGRNSSIRKLKASINDDLEDFIQEIQNGHRPSMILLEQPDMLFLHKMLTKKELIQVRNNDSPFWNSIVGGGGILHGLESEPSFNDLMKNNKPKFVLCFGNRLTILLK